MEEAVTCEGVVGLEKEIDSQKEMPEENPEPADEGRSSIKELEKKNAELLDKLVRLQAEFENYKKRAAKERDEYIQLANARLIKDILGVLDNFERAMADTGNLSNGQSFRKGIEMIYGQLKDVLSTEGVVEIDTDCRLDPFEHEVMMKIDDPEYRDDEIVECLQKGYKMKGKVIRPARVVVCRIDRASEKKCRVVHNELADEDNEVMKE